MLFRKKDLCEEIRRCDVVLFEGILIFYHKEIRDLFNMKLFVDSDADTRLSRRGAFYFSRAVTYVLYKSEYLKAGM